MMNKSRLPCSLSVRTTAIFLCLSVAGCSSLFGEKVVVKNVEPKTTSLITSLGVKPITVEKTTLSPGAIDVIRNGYAELVGQIDNASLSRQLDLRLADVEMLLAEELQVSGNGEQRDDEVLYQRAINAYKTVLTNYPGDVSEAEVLYQLSRAYDLQGKSRESAIILAELLKLQPDSIHASEAWFRQGEAYFSEGDYANAASAYSKVLEAQKFDTFYTMSAYMQGWSYYKLEEQEAALVSFDAMLTASFAHLPDASSDFVYGQPEVSDLSKGQQKLVQDSLRVMALLFSYRGNGEAIVDFYRFYGDKPHSYLVYNELAQQHIDNDRFLDAAEAYLAFANSHTGHGEAVPFYVKHIDAFILGDFPSEVMNAKAGFVNTFGYETGNYTRLSMINREKANPYLYQYLQELAQSNHSLAQQLVNPEKRTLLPDALQLLDDDALNDQASLAFSEAAKYYLEFISTFPDDEKRPQIQFNLAESYFQAQQYALAIAQYEDYAYRYVNHGSASDGAYTALLAYDALLINSGDNSDEYTLTWLEKQRKSRDDFIITFTSDPRAISVTQTLMQSQFDKAQFADALFYSQWLLTPPDAVTQKISESLRYSANLVKAHSFFGLEQYAEAEKSYALLLQSIESDNSDYNALVRNYAVSMYKQAEYAVASNDLDQAIGHLKRIIDKTPNVDVRINAQYDAATYLLALSRFDEAQRMLQDFEARFPGNALTSTIENKLLYIFEQTEQWKPAADILYRQWTLEKDTDAGREALLLAAEYYELAGDRTLSLPAYRAYAHAYPEPFDTVTEVRLLMSEFYKQSGEGEKQRFWLNKLIMGHDNAGSSQTARSLTLAAMSAMVFANDAKRTFAAIKLEQPLRDTLSKKRDALERAVLTHNKVLTYGVREYATVANHQLGELYLTLASDLMASQRPTELSALEREQYDLLLEEQAYPFEEEAIKVFETNAKRSWGGVYDEWVRASFDKLSSLLPSAYRKPEKVEALDVNRY
jgi:tetratricopeptide (TPR) repeat protein